MQFVLQLQVLSITHSTPSKMRKKNGEYVSHRCCQKFLHEITASGELTYVKCSLHHLSLLHSGSILIFHFRLLMSTLDLLVLLTKLSLHITSSSLFHSQILPSLTKYTFLMMGSLISESLPCICSNFSFS